MIITPNIYKRDFELLEKYKSIAVSLRNELDEKQIAVDGAICAYENQVNKFYERRLTETFGWEMCAVQIELTDAGFISLNGTYTFDPSKRVRVNSELRPWVAAEKILLTRDGFRTYAGQQLFNPDIFFTAQVVKIPLPVFKERKKKAQA